ncbi:putative Kinesin-II 85 kDa subunit [Blattamonas nauphoetae]|uniref:Kinesin-II 85 kDa subunit n=1 Tax=Blattamonas nauphoetae TaxID=2049346 RepID=A0ABQ9Y6N7_9EUKA|nr:putative Kinesin-II 85 kDa subunit [Blattamonas nauphoetae]
MGTYQGLYHLLIFDGFFELFCGLALAAPTFLFILGFTKYLRQLKLFRTGKYLELLILCIYTGWKVIFNVVSMLSFKEYYGFTQFFELMGTVLLLVMSLITVFTMRTRKQRFLYAQFLGLLYVCLHLFGLCYTFLQSFTVGFSRIASIVFFGSIRVRPLNSKEKKEKCTEIQKITGKTIAVTNPENKKETKTFTFDYAYGTSTGQDIVFNDLGLLYLENAWKGYNCTLFAYGQTGSGKSFSMTGDLSSETTRGIIPRGCEEMFKRIKDTSSELISYEVRCSFLEMYNEKLQDLLDPKSTKTISVRESTKKGIYVENALEEPVESYSDINRLLEEGNKARTVAATAMNSESSRSHSVLTIFFTRKEKKGTATTQRESRINLVDLAGSERQSKTGATGQRLTEAAAINKSLSALGNVIKALADISSGKKNIFVPYRDSLLTRMLQDSLGGNSKTIMIAAMSPASSNYDEGVSTLQYADRAKQIKNKPVVNESETDKLIRSLQEEIADLREQLGAGGGGSGGSRVVEASLTAEEEAQLLERQKRADDALAKQRDDLLREQQETARLEAKLAQEREELNNQLASLKRKTADSVEIKAINAKLAQLETEQKQLAQQAETESLKEQDLLLKQAEADRLRKEQEQAKLDLLIASKQISDMTATAAQRKKAAEAARKRRRAFLADMGLSVAESAEAAGLKTDHPFLTNLSLSRDMSGNLLYVLPNDTPFRVGSDPSKAQIVCSAIGIAPLHGTFRFDTSANRVQLTAADKCRILFNGNWMEGGTTVNLSPGDRLIFGRAFCLRFVFDKMQRVAAMDPEEESQLIQAEMAVAAGKCRNVAEFFDKDGAKLALLHADMLIDEANEIARKLGRKVNFGMDILPDGRSVNVIVNSFEHEGSQEWALSVLEDRMPLMRSILADFAADGVIDNPPEKDPFFNPPPDTNLGTASVHLRNVLLAGAMRISVGIRPGGRGKERKAGVLKLAMSMLMKVNGKDTKLPLVDTDEDTFVVSENLATGALTKTRITRIVDTNQILWKEVTVVLDLLSVQLEPEMEHHSDGLFVSFEFPAGRSENTARCTDNGLTKTLRSEEGGTAAQASYAVTFPSFSRTEMDYFLNTKLALTVWGHAPFNEAYPTGGSEEERELAKAKREMEAAKVENQKTREELASLEYAIQRVQDETMKVRAEIEDLEKNKSKSCVIF